IDFSYPTGVVRAYMPDPNGIFQTFAAGLAQAGFHVVGHPTTWNPDYLVLTNAGSAGSLYPLGWTGDYGDPDNFLGTLFGSRQKQFGFDDQRLFSLLARAKHDVNPGARARLYAQANRLIMDLLPGVPFVHTKQAIALS